MFSSWSSCPCRAGAVGVRCEGLRALLSSRGVRASAGLSRSWGAWQQCARPRARWQSAWSWPRLVVSCLAAALRSLAAATGAAGAPLFKQRHSRSTAKTHTPQDGSVSLACQQKYTAGAFYFSILLAVICVENGFRENAKSGSRAGDFFGLFLGMI